MAMQTVHRQKWGLLFPLWLLEGIVVGFGAILPGISGGTLCVAFGMYRPIIECLSRPWEGIKKHWVMLGTFAAGIAVGFVGLSGVAAWMMEKNTALVTCVFIGFIIGTFPELWRDAGKINRSTGSYVSLCVCFSVMLVLLALLKTKASVAIAPGLWGYLLCGLLWGLSFIVPGLSSSSLLLFFGLYAPMLQGISELDFRVLLPMGCGMAGCVLFLSRLVGSAYKKHHSTVSHGVLGIVAATAVMILPAWDGEIFDTAAKVLFILGGAILSCFFTHVCKKIEDTSK